MGAASDGGPKTRTNDDGSVDEYSRNGNTGKDEWHQIVPPMSTASTPTNKSFNEDYFTWQAHVEGAQSQYGKYWYMLANDPNSTTKDWVEYNQLLGEFVEQMNEETVEDAVWEWYKTTDYYKKDQEREGRYLMNWSFYAMSIAPTAVPAPFLASPVKPSFTAFKIGYGTARGYALTEQAVSSELESILIRMNANKDFPATIGGAYLSNGSYSIMTNGAVPDKIAPSLIRLSNRYGGVNTLRGKTTIGRCAEFWSGNSVLLENPRYGVESLRWTPAYRPRGSVIKAPCQNCQDMFNLKSN